MREESKKQKTGFGGCRAQTFVEYTMLIGLLITAFVAMSPMIRRAAQAMVKGVADQVGNQADADQPDEGGYLVYQYMTMRDMKNKNTAQRPDGITFNYMDEWTETETQVMMNLGSSQ